MYFVTLRKFLKGKCIITSCETKIVFVKGITGNIFQSKISYVLIF